ncbi:MAG: DEAD/DEAH box helicase [Sphingomonadales bacterium]
MSFEYLGLSDEVLKAIGDAGYTEPTPIQKQAIPSVLQGRDILGIAQTGTGKTAGFTLPMIDILTQGRARARMPRSLILEPTRELAAQVSESFEKYGKNNKLSMALLIGGVSFGDQLKKLERGVDVLIATPGRLLDHFERGNLMLTGVNIFVIDEADRMLDMGFIPDVEKICKIMVQNHQTLFFSATMPPPIKKLADQFLNDPKTIEVARASSTASTIIQALINTEPRNKKNLLKTLLKDDDINNAIVFCNRKIEVKDVYKTLQSEGFNVAQLHGDMQQSERMEVLGSFKDGTVKILCASDVAARGLDIPSVSHVFNFDVPIHAEDYVHRIGRTGRAGREGFSFTLATKKDQKFVDAIEALIKTKINIKTLDKKSKSLENLNKKPEESQKNSQQTIIENNQKIDKKSKSLENLNKKPEECQKNSQQTIIENNQKIEKKNNETSKKIRKSKNSKSNNHNQVSQETINSKVVGFGDNIPDFLK